MEETISLKEILDTLKKRISLIILITAIATAASGIVSYFFITPIYQASTQILVNQTKDDQAAFQYNEIQTNLQLINTYNVIIKSPRILELVIEELGLNETVDELNEKLRSEAKRTRRSSTFPFKILIRIMQQILPTRSRAFFKRKLKIL